MDLDQDLTGSHDRIGKLSTLKDIRPAVLFEIHRSHHVTVPVFHKNRK
jgi:hypothetical protein